MNRIIKFRVWEISTNKFIETKDGLSFGSSYSGISVYISHKGFLVQQFTGAKDKNGKEIYEGDIVVGYDEMGGEIKGAVYFDTGKYGGTWKFAKSTSPIRTSANLYSWIKYVEIIGNIFEK